MCQTLGGRTGTKMLRRYEVPGVSDSCVKKGMKQCSLGQQLGMGDLGATEEGQERIRPLV